MTMENFGRRAIRRGRYTLLLLGCVSSGALAQSAVPEAQPAAAGGDIIVTANKRGAQRLQDVPAAISAVSGETLQRSAAQSVQDYARDVPSLAVFDTGPNQKKIKIRGVSGSSESEPQETVGVYLDDVNITNPGGTNNENNTSPDLNLFDIDRIEVLKGPQGTLYGAGSMGGTVRLITNAPKLGRYEGEVQARLSQTRSGDPSYAGDAMINVPLAKDVLALRLVGSYRRDGGYIDNVSPTLDRKNYNPAISWVVRSDLRFRPASNVTFDLKYFHRQVMVHGLNSTPEDQPLTSNYLIEPTSRSNMDIVNGVLGIDLDGVTISSSTSYLDRRDIAVRDLTPLGRAFISGIVTAADPAPPIGLHNRNRYHEFAQELRLSSNGSGRLKYVVGAYFSKLSKEFVQDGVWPGLAAYLAANGGVPAALDGKAPVVSPVTGLTDLNFYLATVPQSLRQIALFGEATYAVIDGLDVTVGGRYFDISQHFLFDANANALFVTPDAAFRQSALKENGFNPKATISYKVDPRLMVYATVAKGFRPGGFNQPVSTNAQCLADFQSIGFNPNSVSGFKSDSIWSYEAGVKAQSPGRGVTFNGSVYQEDWNDIQLRNPLTCGFTIFNTASKARIRGLEGSLVLRPAPGLTIALNSAYTDAKLLTASPTTGAVAGERLLGIPRFTIGGSAEYEVPLNARWSGYLRADASYLSGYNSYFSQQLFGGLPENVPLGHYALANLHLGVSDAAGRWDAQLYVNNLFDELGRTGAQNDIFGKLVFRTRPREVGLQLSRKF